MNDIKSKYIIEVFHKDYFKDAEHTYIKKIGNKPWAVSFTPDIYESKYFNTADAARKSAERVVKYIKEAYDNGWTSYGYNYEMNYTTGEGRFTKVLETINYIIHEVKLTIV